MRLSGVGGFLLDLDGVFYVGDRAIPGGVETLEALRERGLPFRFITNTTTRTPEELLEKLARFGIEVGPNEVFTAVSATIRYLRDRGAPSCYCLVRESIRPLLAEFEENAETPDFVVIGDIGARWDYETLNRVFRMLMRGSKLICMHRNKFWEDTSGLRMDIGAFVAALEYVSGRQAVAVGKPSVAFFGGAVRSMGLAPEAAVMVGDDLDSDIGGAQNAGLRAVLVRTGKFREATLERSPLSPDRLIDSIAELPAVLEATS